MRALVQRVRRAAVHVGGEEVGRIGPGLCVLVGVTHTDGEGEASRLAAKVWNLRVLDGSRAGPGIERSLAEVGGEVLAVSQFTLYGDTSKGRRPSWSLAAGASQAEALVEAFCAALRRNGAEVAQGRFGAYMQVELVNDGPVTLMIEV